LKNQPNTRTCQIHLFVIFVTGCIIAFYSQSLSASGADSVAYPELNKTYLKSYYYDTKSFIVSPAKWKARQWIEFGAITGAGILAYTQDEKIQTYFVGHQSETADNLSKYIFEPIGNGIGTSVIIGGFYLGGRLARDKRLAGTSLTAAKAFIVSTVCTQVIKQLTHRHRPYQDEIPDHAQWEGPFADIHYTSFPSGHSTAAFSLATVFALEYSHTVWVPVLAYTLAAGTAVSRLYDNDHWASDVVIGSAIGFVTGRFMWKQSRKGNQKVVILPSFGTNTASLTFIIRLAEPKRSKICF
jgi:membrane-associated phospholipid phosphatase